MQIKKIVNKLFFSFKSSLINVLNYTRKQIQIHALYWFKNGVSMPKIHPECMCILFNITFRLISH